MATLRLRKQNLSWQLSLEVLFLSRSKEHWTENQQDVLEPIIKPFWALRPLLQKGLGNTSPPEFSVRKMERGCVLKTIKFWQRALGLFIPFQPRNCGFLSDWNTERLFDGSHSSLLVATYTLFAKTFLREISFDLNFETQNSLQTHQEPDSSF